MNLLDLPEDFNWGKIGHVCFIRVENIIGEHLELKDLFIAKETSHIAKNEQF